MLLPDTKLLFTLVLHTECSLLYLKVEQGKITYQIQM